MKIRGVIFCIYFFFAVFCLHGFGQRPASELPSDIRVAIETDAKQISIEVPSVYRIELPYTGEILQTGSSLDKVVAYPEMVGVRLGTLNPMVFGLKIIAPTKQSVYLNDKPLRGNISVIRNRNVRLLAINALPLEDYLKSVVPSEIPPRWPKEAIKAQAIISRTYAMYRMTMRRDKPYDVRDDIFSQVYGGKSVEDRRVNNIIQKTQGLVLVSDDNILIPSFFHALCGGRTENVTQAWGGSSIRALEGVECGFCKEAPRFSWSAEFTPLEISNLLDKNGIIISGIEGIEVDGRTSSGRARNVLIRYAGRRERVISATRFRLILGPNILRSTKFSIKEQGDRFIFNGQGWGHGVGLCQWGAYFMAKQGYTAEQILQHYYPFSNVVPSSEALLPLKND